MSTITSNLQKLYKEISNAEHHFHQKQGSVKLLAVSKGQSINAILEAISNGQFAFGENYLQEALPKIAAIHNPQVEWHFIGTIQTNKTRAIAENFSWVHSVTHLKIAERFNSQRPQHLPPLNICIELNLDQEKNKAGIDLDNLSGFATKIIAFPALKLRGLMAIPKPKKSFIEQRESFHKLQRALKKLQQEGFDVDTLSMGMSDDFVAAIAEGATIIRVGTALFGKQSIIVV